MPHALKHVQQEPRCWLLKAIDESICSVTLFVRSRIAGRISQACVRYGMNHGRHCSPRSAKRTPSFLVGSVHPFAMKACRSTSPRLFLTTISSLQTPHVSRFCCLAQKTVSSILEQTQPRPTCPPRLAGTSRRSGFQGSMSAPRPGSSGSMRSRSAARPHTCARTPMG